MKGATVQGTYQIRAKGGCKPPNINARNTRRMMKKEGKDVVLCPFHTETVGSCCIDHATRTFHCYGCGKQGEIGKEGEFILSEDFVDE